MHLAEIVLIAVGLAMDAFAVSIAGAASGRLTGARSSIRLAFHLGWFQAMMPVLGWFAGSEVAEVTSAYGRWIAFFLLAWVGLRMVRSALAHGEEPSAGDPSRGLAMIAVCVATSIDALAVGLSLGVLGVGIWVPSAIIGVVTAAISLTGIVIGARLGARLGSRLELAGGALLIAIGLKLLLSG